MCNIKFTQCHNVNCYISQIFFGKGSLLSFSINQVDLVVDIAIHSWLQFLWTITFSAKFFSAKLFSNCPLFEKILMSLEASIFDGVVQLPKKRGIVVYRCTTPFLALTIPQNI